MAKCLPWKHVWITEIDFRGKQVQRCKQCGTTK